MIVSIIISYRRRSCTRQLQNIVTRFFFGVLTCSTLIACDPSASVPQSSDPADAALSFGDLSIPIEFENLQVLPENISRRDLMNNMKQMSRSLGVRCKHCHDMKTEDYSADDIEAKRIAREMMRIVQKLNTEVFVGEDTPQATCYMCHREELEPTLKLPVRVGRDPVIVPQSKIEG